MLFEIKNLIPENFSGIKRRKAESCLKQSCNYYS